ncbi:MAG TPA: peptide chain release factor 1, partial [Roseovarius sp.]|nr:peptide chain release factor 1 [Roseovarius sp.]
MVPLDRLQRIVERFEYIEAQMAQGGGDLARLGREYAELRPVVEEIRTYRQALDDLEAARGMLDDAEMRELAEGEIAGIEARLPEMEQALRLALLPRDAADAR